VRELGDLFLKTHVEAKRKPAMLRNYKALLNHYVYPAIGAKRAAEVKRIEIARLHFDMARVQQQANRMLATLKSIYSFAAAALRLFMFTGCRVSEIIRLRWEDYDAERGLLILPDSKTGRKVVVLNGPAVEELEHLPRSARNPFVVQGKKAGAAMADIDRPWRIVLHHVMSV
jgi:integrase